MAKKEEKILTKNQVLRLGLDKVSVITADMLDGYTSIGDYAFDYCIGLKSVTIPNNVTSIGERAFRNCIGLTSVVIGDGVTSIGYDAFAYCYGLTSVIIPNSVTSIGGCAFWKCTGLKSVTIPNSVISIGMDAFYNCHSLIMVTIGDKTYEKQTITNNNCKAYKAFNANMTCRDFQYKEGKTFKINGKPELCKRGFHACLNLADVFSYYSGKLGNGVVVYDVELEGVSNDRHIDSKVVAKKITIGKRIL